MYLSIFLQVLQLLATKMSLLEDVSPAEKTPKIERHISSEHEKRPNQNIGNVHEVINAFKCKICEYKSGRKSVIIKPQEIII